MGLKSNGGNATFVSIIDSKFTVRVQEGTPEAEERKLTKGKNAGTVVHELRYSSLSGIIKKIEYVKKQFGNFIEIVIADDKDYTLQIPWESFTARDNFIKRLPNIILSDEVEFVVFKDDKGRMVFLIKQYNIWVPPAFTKDNPNGMPPAKKDAKGDWDFRDVEEFLFNVLEEQTKRFGGEEVVNETVEKAKELFNAEEPAPF